jgi:hypothetical protein
MARHVHLSQRSNRDSTIEFLRDELKDRRTQISGMKEIIEGQRQLLEVMNGNMAPIFGALAKLVAPKSREQENGPIIATMVNDVEGDTEAASVILAGIAEGSIGRNTDARLAMLAVPVDHGVAHAEQLVPA